MNYSLQNYGCCGCPSKAKTNPDAKLGLGALAVGIVGAWMINAALNSEGVQRTFDASELLPSGQTKDERLATIGSVAAFYTVGVLLGAAQKSAS